MYHKRINTFINFSIEYFNNSKFLDRKIEQLKKNKNLIFLLDECVKEYNSKEFASLIEEKIIKDIKNITFIIGGPSSFSKKIIDNFKIKIYLSKMTFSHQLIRAFFCEQLYRAFIIINNHPYHSS